MKMLTLAIFLLTLAACHNGDGGPSSSQAQPPSQTQDQDDKRPTAQIFQIAAGEFHNCGLDIYGVRCWGDDVWGQTNGVPPLDHPTKIFAGGNDSCALDAKGLQCWGDDNYGILSQKPALTNPRQAAIGSQHICTLDDSGVQCWGRDNEGQVSHKPALTQVTEIAAGENFSCALDATAVHCWGADDFKQVSHAPTNLKHPRALVASGFNGAVIDDNGVHFWGFDEATIMKKMPALVNPKQAAIAGLANVYCVIDDAGNHCVSSFGSEFSDYGGTQVKKPTQIVGGDFHMCELGREGVWCWGRDDYYGHGQVKNTPTTLGLQAPVIPPADKSKMPTFLAPVRNDDGSLKVVSQSDAAQSCSSIGARLPTAREFARWAQAKGAEGVLEIGNPIPDRSYTRVETYNGGADNSFYYSPKGFVTDQAKDDFTAMFWTSSPAAQFSSFDFVEFDGVRGSLERAFSSDRAIRCVRD